MSARCTLSCITQTFPRWSAMEMRWQRDTCQKPIRTFSLIIKNTISWHGILNQGHGMVFSSTSTVSIQKAGVGCPVYSATKCTTIISPLCWRRNIQRIRKTLQVLQSLLPVPPPLRSLFRQTEQTRLSGSRSDPAHLNPLHRPL